MKTNTERKISPAAKVLTAEKEGLANLFKAFYVFLFVIAALVDFIFISEILDHNHVDLSFLGVEISTEYVGWVAFIFVGITGFLLGLLVFIYLIFIKLLTAKIETLNNSYNTMELTEQILLKLSGSSDVVVDTEVNKKKRRQVSHTFRCSQCNNMVEAYPCSHCGYSTVNEQVSKNAIVENVKDYCDICGQMKADVTRVFVDMQTGYRTICKDCQDKQK